MSEQLLTEQDLARMLQVSIITVRRWRAAGKGPKFVRCGTKVVRYRIAAVNHWLLMGNGKKFGSAAA
jgi:predicted DNA-binding transcriptional regulator AlpA